MNEMFWLTGVLNLVHTITIYFNVVSAFYLNTSSQFLHYLFFIQHYRRSIYTKILAFTVSVMTFWKTVLYIAMFYELAGGKDYRSGNTLQDEILLVLIPNGIWILLPALCMLCLWGQLINSQRESTSSYKLKDPWTLNVVNSLTRTICVYLRLTNVYIVLKIL